MNVFERVLEGFRVFRGRDHPDFSSGDNWGRSVQVTQYNPGYGTGAVSYGPWGPSSSDRPDRLRLKPGNEKTIIVAVENRIALDVAAVEFHHARIDENDMFKEVVPGSIEEMLTVEANIDQSAQAYMIDLVMSMFDEGVVAEVPVECDRKADGSITDKEPIQMRVGKVVQWMPDQVKINLYNQLTGKMEDLPLPVSKREVCIIENPFYSIMNKKNSIFQRLTRKMAILDMVDEKQGSDKLNMVVQLPYIVRTDTQRATARARLNEMEKQLAESKLGITYVDGTEKIIQMNKPIDTSLQAQIEWLTDLFLSQLCITKEILNGTADAKVMANYQQRVVGVICAGIAGERRRKLLTRDQRKNRESIVFVQDPFKLIPITELSDLMDKSIRGAILTPNEWRSIIGYKPSDDATADILANRNMPIDQTPEAMDSEVQAETAELLPEMQQSAVPMNRQQRRHPNRSKVPRSRSG